MGVRRAWGALATVAVLVASAAAVYAVRAPGASAATPVTVLTDGFEDGTTQGFTPRAAETVANSTTVAQAGTHSLAVSGRTASWQGPALDILSTVEVGTTYTFGAWVRLAAGEASTPLRISIERHTAGTASYDQVTGNTAVTADGWVHLSGTYILASTVDFLAVYVESASGTPSFFLDDFSISYLPPTPIQADIPSLKSVFASSFPIGAAVGRAELTGVHGSLLSKHFNSLTPGNALKWDATEPTEGTFTFTDSDAIVAYAKANGMQVRGHTLVWYQQTPAWVFQDATGATMTPTDANKALLLSRLEAHIRGVVGHYGTDIGTWDVVNEAIDETQSDGMRHSMWYTITGLDYIRTAFRVAHEVAPTAKLFINDYNTTVPAKRDKLASLVSQLRAEGVPIDGIGQQMHVNVAWPSLADTETAITTFAALGVQQQITEMDVSVYTDNTSSYTTIPDSLLATQAQRYHDFFALYQRYSSAITSVTVWGLADDDTWLSTFPITRLDEPLLFDQQLQAKPAYWALVGGSPSASASRSASASASPTKSASPSASATGAGGSTCAVTYAITGSWPGGFQGSVTATDTGAAAWNDWTLGWSFANGQQVTQLWNGAVTQSGAAVRVTDAGYNKSVAAGGSVTVGFLASWTGTNAKPTAFTVNGMSCAVR